MHSDMLLALTGTVPELMDAALRPAVAAAHMSQDAEGTEEGTVLFGYGASNVLTLFGSRPGWTVHVPGHPDEVRRVVLESVARGDRAYIHVSPQSNAEPRGIGGGHGFEMVREGRSGVVVAVGPLLDPVLRATAGLDLAVLYTATIRPFDSVGLRTAVLAVDHPDVILVEPCARGTSAHQVAETLLQVPHRLLALGTSSDDGPVGGGSGEGSAGGGSGDGPVGAGRGGDGGPGVGLDAAGGHGMGDGLDDCMGDGLDEESIAAAVRDFMR
ncbi:transketolase [Streptomyces sp. NPDC002896]|uniref:transketolase n=1 Tax=Streptomyces sp. NPDC002896 TaxID=3154438 RepID=UPI003321C8A5